MSLLEVRGLTTAFQTGRGEISAIEDISFDLNEGEILGIVGESGSGKSVTALTIMGLLPQPPARIAAGSVRFAGEATSPNFFSTAHGARDSGERAAREVRG